MHVDAAVARQVQHFRPEDLAKSNDNNQVRLPGLKLSHGLRLAQAARLDNWQVQILGEQFYRRRGEHLTSPGRAVGLGYDPNDLVAGSQGHQRGQGKLWRTHEDNGWLHTEILTQVRQRGWQNIRAISNNKYQYSSAALAFQ
jgi:hypothetical protein